MGGGDLIQPRLVGADSNPEEVLEFWADNEILNVSSYSDQVLKKGRQGQLTIWSTCLIGGKVFPGVANLDDAGACICIPSAKVRYAIDRQKAQGQTKEERKALLAQQAKGIETYRILSDGYVPGPVLLRVGIWRIEQWRAFKKYLPQINPKLKENKLKPLLIDHPYLAALGIDQIFINEISTPTESGTWGLHWIDIGCHEVFGSNNKSSNIAQKIKPQDTGDDLGVKLSDQRFEVDKRDLRP